MILSTVMLLAVIVTTTRVSCALCGRASPATCARILHRHTTSVCDLQPQPCNARRDSYVSDGTRSEHNNRAPRLHVMLHVVLCLAHAKGACSTQQRPQLELAQEGAGWLEQYTHTGRPRAS